MVSRAAVPKKNKADCATIHDPELNDPYYSVLFSVQSVSKTVFDFPVQ